MGVQLLIFDLTFELLLLMSSREDGEIGLIGRKKGRKEGRKEGLLFQQVEQNFAVNISDFCRQLLTTTTMMMSPKYNTSRKLISDLFGTFLEEKKHRPCATHGKSKNHTP